MNEIDYLMRVDPDGVITYEGEAKAKYERVDEWCGTPQGAIWGMPNWGNNFVKYKHQPTNEYLAVFIQSDVYEKVGKDLPEIELSGVNCFPMSKDSYCIEIVTPDFVFTFELPTVKGLENG